jgi:hypothetical protein
MKGSGIYIVGLAAWLHIPWALVLLVNPEIHRDTPTAGFYWILSTPFSVAISLIAISILAFTGEIYWNGWLRFWSLIPQQLALIISASSSIVAILHGHYADNYIAPRDFIFKDQWGNILTTLVHLWYMATLFATLKTKTKTQ